MKATIADEQIDFEGTLAVEDSFMPSSRVRGQLRWIDEGKATARVAGAIAVERGGRDDLFRDLGVSSFRGRTARLSIAGVGLSPVRIYSDGKPLPGGPTVVDFEAWAPPVPIATHPELAEALRMPIADALEQAGQVGLAGLARAAAVALGGFTEPPPRGRNRSARPG